MPGYFYDEFEIGRVFKHAIRRTVKFLESVARAGQHRVRSRLTIGQLLRRRARGPGAHPAETLRLRTFASDTGEKAAAAASRIEAYVLEIEHQIGWMRLPQAGAANPDQRRFDYLKLLRE